jgi:hypothetical protein
LATIEFGPQKTPFSRCTNAAREDLLHVDQKRHRQHHREKLVKEENRSESAHALGQPARPDALAEAHRQARGGESEKRGEQDRVHVSLLAREAHEKPPAPPCSPAFCCRLLQIRHFSLHLSTSS